MALGINGYSCVFKSFVDFAQRKFAERETKAIADATLDNHKIVFGSQSCATRLVIGAFVFVASAAAFRRLGFSHSSFTGLADLAAIALVCYDFRLYAKHSWLHQSDS